MSETMPEWDELRTWKAIAAQRLALLEALEKTLAEVRAENRRLMEQLSATGCSALRELQEMRRKG